MMAPFSKVSGKDFENGNIAHNIMYLALPLLAANLMQNFFSMFDMFLLGKLGVQSQSAISIAGFVFAIFWSLEGGLMMGASAIVARYMGKKDYASLKNYAVNAIFAGYVMGITFAAINYAFMGQILAYFGAKGDTLLLAKSIFGMSLISLINDSGLFIFFAMLRAAGRVRDHFYLLVLSISLNTILEPLLMFGWLGFPKLGILGAPMARFLGYFVTTFVMLYILTNDKGLLRIEKQHLKLDFKFLLNYISISLPGGFQGIASNVAALVMLKIASVKGDALITALGIGSRIDVFIMMIGWAIGGSVAVLVGHNLGAKRPDRAEQSIMTGLKFYSVFTFAWFMICFNMPGVVMRIFSADPDVIYYGSQYLKTVSPLYLMLGVWLLTSAAFNGAGATKTPMVINILAFFLIQIPLAFFLSKHPSVGHRAIFISIAAVFLFQGIAGWVMYKRGKWKEKEI